MKSYPGEDCVQCSLMNTSNKYCIFMLIDLFYLFMFIQSDALISEVST